MDAKELRTFSLDELKGRIHQWQEELFRTRFKSETSEAKDTSLVKKMRRDIARGKTVLAEKLKGIVVETREKTAAPSDKIAASAAPKEEKAPRKTAAKKTTTRKKAKEE